MTDLPQEFGVSIVPIDGHSFVRVTGEIDLATATELRQRLDSVIAAGDVDLDLSAVTFLDPSGLGVLLAARRGLNDKHHRLTVRNPSQRVLRVFELSGVLDLMIVPPRGAARPQLAAASDADQIVAEGGLTSLAAHPPPITYR